MISHRVFSYDDIFRFQDPFWRSGAILDSLQNQTQIQTETLNSSKLGYTKYCTW